MYTESSDTDLHLPGLSIKGFRGIADLSIPQLGRVTLIAGKNGVGKTTLLDAVRIYAARGSNFALTDVLQDREELITAVADEDSEELSAPDFGALFHGRSLSPGSLISIGPNSETKRLTIRVNPNLHKPDISSTSDKPLLEIEFQGKKEEIFIVPWLPYRVPRRMPQAHESKLPPAIRCESSGPSLMDNESIAGFWDSVALTDYETQAVQALRLVYGDEVDRVAMVGDEKRPHPIYNRRALYGPLYGRRAVVKIKKQERPVPLKSLGDGAVRLFGVALALANSKDGFLVIDEAENGVHHSVQPDFWKMVMRTAHDNNVQVLATTHSWDCVAGFAQAAIDSEEVNGVLIRLEKDINGIRAVGYSEDNLKAAAKHGIEVR